MNSLATIRNDLAIFERELERLKFENENLKLLLYRYKTGNWQNEISEETASEVKASKILLSQNGQGVDIVKI